MASPEGLVPRAEPGEASAGVPAKAPPSSDAASEQSATTPRMTKPGAALGLWLALSIVTVMPYAVAQIRPPEGTRFKGIFFYRDDFYQYMSFAEQASRGAFVFRNKFNIEPHQPVIVNLEWWAIGVLGAALGGRLEAAYHVVRLAALAGLVAALRRLLAAAGLTSARLGWALALVMTGGGLGWLRLAQGRPGSFIPDLLMGIYPWHQALLNGHAVVGTALFLWTILLHLDWRAGQGPRWRWIASGWALGLCRPYDLLVFAVMAVVLAVRDLVRGAPRRAVVDSVLSLIWLAPVFAYYALLLRPGSPFRGWDGVQSGDLNPPTFEFAFAVGPAALLWLVFRRYGSRELRATLSVLAVILVALILLYRAPLMKTFVTSSGAVVLLLAASVVPRSWLPAATALLCPTSVFLLWRALHPWPECFAPEDYFRAVEDLRSACAPQDFALAPTDLSLMIGGLTPCAVSVGHRGLTPDYPRRVAEGEQFYDPATSPEWRLRYLRDTRARFVLLAAGRGAWLGGASHWAPRLKLRLFEIWEAASDPRSAQ
jgi:hypothetical protein